MGTVIIKSIENQALRRAAEAADSQGEKSYNGELDACELSVFIKEAAKSGYNTNEIMEVVNNVGVAKDDTETQETIKNYNELVKLKNTLASRTQELNRRKGQLDDMKADLDDMKPEKGKTGENIGFWAGGMAGAAYITKLCPGPWKLVGAVGGFIAGAGLGTIGGFGIDALINKFMPDSHEAKVQEKSMNNYKESAIAPLENEIKELKEQVEAKESEFFD